VRKKSSTEKEPGKKKGPIINLETNRRVFGWEWRESPTRKIVFMNGRTVLGENGHTHKKFTFGSGGGDRL